jgi:hypothetical protein
MIVHMFSGLCHRVVLYPPTKLLGVTTQATTYDHWIGFRLFIGRGACGSVVG